jgi:PEP-CTERM motif
MPKTLLMTTGLAWLALTGAAGAAVTVTLTPGPMDPQYFAGEAAHQNGFTIDGVTWSLVSGVAETEKGSLTNVYAAPLGMGTNPLTGTTYMSVEGGGTEMATWNTPQTSLALYWGSIDGDGNINSLSISMGAYTLTGVELATMFGADGNGNQVSPLGNQLVRITGLDPFTTATFSSTANAFEFSLASVPEPSTWAMMALGFAGLGYAAFRQNSKGRALAI